MQPRPELSNPLEYKEYPTSPYLHKYASKIKRDLNRYFKLYTGKKCKVLKLITDGERCGVCTDSITGAKLLSECDTCGGTGFVNKYNILDTIYYGHVIYGPDTIVSDPAGYKETTRADLKIVCDVPLSSGDLVAFLDTKHVFKIIDQGSDLSAVQGIVVMQALQVSLLEERSHEYRQVDWSEPTP